MNTTAVALRDFRNTAYACFTRRRDALFELVRRAWPYRTLSRDEFDALVRLHADNGRRSLLHRDGVNGRVRATARARFAALLSGGAIPDTADYQVRLEPEGTVIGTGPHTLPTTAAASTWSWQTTESICS